MLIIIFKISALWHFLCWQHFFLLHALNAIEEFFCKELHRKVVFWNHVLFLLNLSQLPNRQFSAELELYAYLWFWFVFFFLFGAIFITCLLFTTAGVFWVLFFSPWFIQPKLRIVILVRWIERTMLGRLHRSSTFHYQGYWDCNQMKHSWDRLRNLCPSLLLPWTLPFLFLPLPQVCRRDFVCTCFLLWFC